MWLEFAHLKSDALLPWDNELKRRVYTIDILNSFRLAINKK